MTKISCLGSWYPRFERVIFSPWPINQLHVALVRGPLTPALLYTHQLFVDHDWQDRAIREQFIMPLCNTTAVVPIRLGLWPLESGTSEIVAWGGGGRGKFLGDFLNERAQKWLKVRNDTLFFFESVGYPLKQEIFIMEISKRFFWWFS